MGEPTPHEPQGAASDGDGAPPKALQYRDRGCASGRRLVEPLGGGLEVQYEIDTRAGGDERSGEGVVFRGRRLPLQREPEWERNNVVAIKVIADDLFGLEVSQDQLLDHYALMIDQFYLVRAIRARGLVVPHSVFLVDATAPGHEWLYSMYDGDVPLFLGSPIRPVAIVEWLAGVPLRHWNAAHGPLDRVEVLRPIAQAIDTMRLNGASFRDLKPDNFVVVGDGAVLVDLGMVVPAELPMFDPRSPGLYVDPDRQSYGYTRDLYAFAALIVHQLTFPSTPSGRDHIAAQADRQARGRLAEAGMPEEIGDLLAVELHQDRAGRGRRGRGIGPALEDLLTAVYDVLRRPPGRGRRWGSR